MVRVKSRAGISFCLEVTVKVKVGFRARDTARVKFGIG